MQICPCRFGIWFFRTKCSIHMTWVYLEQEVYTWHEWFFHMTLLGGLAFYILSACSPFSTSYLFNTLRAILWHVSVIDYHLGDSLFLAAIFPYGLYAIHCLTDMWFWFHHFNDTIRELCQIKNYASFFHWNFIWEINTYLSIDYTETFRQVPSMGNRILL